MHVDHVPVRAGVESDELLFGDAGVHQHRQMEQVPERRHGAQFALREQLAKLTLGGQPDAGIVQKRCERIEVDQVMSTARP